MASTVHTSAQTPIASLSSSVYYIPRQSRKCEIPFLFPVVAALRRLPPRLQPARRSVMAKSTQGRLSRQVGRGRRVMVEDQDLCFTRLLPKEQIEAALERHRVRYRERLYTPRLTIRTFLYQVLASDQSCWRPWRVQPAKCFAETWLRAYTVDVRSWTRCGKHGIGGLPATVVASHTPDTLGPAAAFIQTGFHKRREERRCAMLLG
jgi:hypothetical protein